SSWRKHRRLHLGHEMEIQEKFRQSVLLGLSKAQKEAFEFHQNPRRTLRLAYIRLPVRSECFSDSNRVLLTENKFPGHNHTQRQITSGQQASISQSETNDQSNKPITSQNLGQIPTASLRAPRTPDSREHLLKRKR